jgi:hypothetical protein
VVFPVSSPLEVPSIFPFGVSNIENLNVSNISLRVFVMSSLSVSLMSSPFDVLIPSPSRCLPLLIFLISFILVFLYHPLYVYLISSRAIMCFKCFNLCHENWNYEYRSLFRFKLFKTKRNLLYIRNQSVPRSKHFPPRLLKPFYDV